MEIRYLGLPPAGLAAMAAGALILLAWYYRYLTRVRFPRPAAPLLLRGAAMASIIVLAANPVFFFDAKKPVPRRVAILVDSSQSMLLEDPGTRGERLAGGKPTLLDGSRFARAREAAVRISRGLDSQRSWIFTFSDRARGASASSLEPAKAFGKATYLLSSVDEADTGEGLPPTDVVALTDGRDNSGMATSTRRAGAPRFYAVGIGRPGPDVNVSLGELRHPDVAFVNQQIMLRGELKLAGMPKGTEVTVELTERGRRVSAAKVVSSGKELSGRGFSIAYTTKDVGMKTLTIRAVSAVKEDVELDNTRTVFVDVISGKRKILAVDTPRWEFTFLNRWLGAQEKVETRTLLLTAGRSAGSENRGAISSAAALSGYKLVIAGQIGKAATASERRAILDYLRGGGSVILLGGENSLFTAGDSSWNALLRPLRGDDPGQDAEPFAPRLTQLGRENPLTRILPDKDANAELWPSLPYLYTYNAFTGPAGMEVLAEHPWAECGGRKCALAARARAGRGRLFVFAFDGLWRWKLTRRPSDNYEKLLGNVASELLEPEETRAVRLSLPKRNYILGSEVCFEAGLEAGLARAGAPAAVVSLNGSKKKTRVAMSRKTGGGEFFKGCFRPAEAGVYSINVKAGGASSGEEPFAVEYAREEFALSSLNEEFLRGLAKSSGGAFYAGDGVDSLVKELNRPGRWRSVRVEAEVWRPPLCWYFLAFVLSALSLEWFIRRRGGLT